MNKFIDNSFDVFKTGLSELINYTFILRQAVYGNHRNIDIQDVRVFLDMVLEKMNETMKKAEEVQYQISLLKY